MHDEFADLLLKAAEGDQLAFKQLYEQSSPKLMGFSLRIVKTKDFAEDVLQEAYVKIWQKADTYTPTKGRALTWMATIVRNKSLDKLRQLKTKAAEIETQYEGLEFTSEDLTPDNTKSLSEEMQQLATCLNKLKPAQRECILLSYYYGHTHQELSEKLGEPLGTVKSWIRRGLEDIRPCLT